MEGMLDYLLCVNNKIQAHIRENLNSTYLEFPIKCGKLQVCQEQRKSSWLEWKTLRLDFMTLDNYTMDICRSIIVVSILAYTSA